MRLLLQIGRSQGISSSNFPLQVTSELQALLLVLTPLPHVTEQEDQEDHDPAQPPRLHSTSSLSFPAQQPTPSQTLFLTEVPGPQVTEQGSSSCHSDHWPDLERMVPKLDQRRPSKIDSSPSPMLHSSISLSFPLQQPPSPLQTLFFREIPRPQVTEQGTTSSHSDQEPEVEGEVCCY